jgi:uncharacterized DUF497 family protein
VTFKRVATVFGDPLILSQPDDEHSGYEERWASIGVDESGVPLVVVHVFRDESDEVVRIISAREAEPRERREYYERP